MRIWAAYQMMSVGYLRYHSFRGNEMHYLVDAEDE